MHRRQLLLSLPLAGCAWACGAARAEPPALLASGGELREDARYRFPLALLQAALAAAGRGDTVQPVYGLNQRRIRRAVQDGSLHIGVLPSLGIDSRRLGHAPFPLRRGLLGLRLLLARESEAEALGRIDSLAALRRLRIGVGADWAERAALQALGFRLVEASSYPALFEMLRGGRIDLLGRGVTEVWDELADPRLAGSGLALVPGIALFYPIDDYFVAPRNRLDLLQSVADGLARLVDSGDYWSLLSAHYGEALVRTGLAGRRIFELHGFGVDPGTPLDLFDALDLRPVQGVFRTSGSRSPGGADAPA